MNSTSLNLAPYVRAIKQGNIVAFPTETVYGLGADAFNPEAVSSVFRAKERPADNPLIVHIATMDMLQSVVKHVGNEVNLLLSTYWPGPLTVILPKSNQIPPLVTGGLDTVAVRMPDHPLALNLIRQCGPLVAPSANKSGRPSPTLPAHVREDFGPELLLLDGGPTKVGLESTVLNCTSTTWQILRPGIISAEMITQTCNVPVRPYNEEDSPIENVRSPGQKYRHYAPEASISWLAHHELNQKLDKKTLYIVHSTDIEDVKNHIFNFRGDFEKLASQLYGLFRYADQSGYEQIKIEPFAQNTAENRWIEPLLNRINKAKAQ